MNLPTNEVEVIGVLWFLLPGFVAAGIFQSLIPNPKPGATDVIIRAFIFTTAVQLLALLLFKFTDYCGWTIASDGTLGILIVTLIAIALGLFSAYVWNNDWIHGMLRRCNVTKECSYQSAQYSAFANHGNCYVVLHLKGERRLFGWPKEWPSGPDDQHLLINECIWLEDSTDAESTANEEYVSHILIPTREVEMIEFLPIKPDNALQE